MTENSHSNTDAS